MRTATRSLRGLLMVLLLCGGLVVPRLAAAVIIADDGFAYAPGDLTGQNGGTGDWKDLWSADSEFSMITK